MHQSLLLAIRVQFDIGGWDRDEVGDVADSMNFDEPYTLDLREAKVEIEVVPFPDVADLDLVNTGVYHRHMDRWWHNFPNRTPIEMEAQ